jgi:hypothetical protein
MGGESKRIEEERIKVKGNAKSKSKAKSKAARTGAFAHEPEL